MKTALRILVLALCAASPLSLWVFWEVNGLSLPEATVPRGNFEWFQFAFAAVVIPACTWLGKQVQIAHAKRDEENERVMTELRRLLSSDDATCQMQPSLPRAGVRT